MKFIPYIFFCCSVLPAQHSQFFREDITFKLDSTFFNVEGLYWFTNISQKQIHSRLFYPFPNYSNEQVDSITVFNISGGREINFDIEAGHGISFALSLPPGDTALFLIKYRQKVSGDSAVYILTTTRIWGKPLSRAEFKLICAEDFFIKSFSYQPDSIYLIDKQRIYYWSKENFLPLKNMVFHF